MFRLDNLLERWAELYAPLSHSAAATVPCGSPQGSSTVPCGSPQGSSPAGAQPSFFRISMIDANSYFVRNYNTLGNACMAYATHVDAEVNKQNPKQLTYRHVIYFLVKQPAGTLSKTQITDEEGATEARFATDDMVQDFIALLAALKGMVGGKSLPATVLSGLPAEMLQFIRDTAADPQYREGLRGLHLDEAHWGTLPTMLNGWQICGLTIEQTVPRLVCVNQERYVQND